jgi:hypothetical protein
MLPLAANVPSPSACGRVHEPPNETLCAPSVQSKSCETDGVSTRKTPPF